MQGFSSKYVFDGTSMLENKTVLVDKNKIINIVDLSDIPAGTTVTNFGDGVITPGFIDLQLNGCGGVLFNDSISLETLEVMYQTWRRYGSTGFLPTLITSPFVDVIKSLQVTQEWFSLYGNTRGVLGIHLEGPFLSKSKSGIHPKEYIITPTDEMLQKIVAYRRHFPIKMTIAVEEFSEQQIKFLVDNNIIISIGHCNASYAVATKSIELGASTATHIFNAMSGLTGRNPGVIGAILNSDIYAGLIVDMLHVDAGNVKLLEKIKKNQIYLVTDAVTPTGTEMEEFEFAGKTLFVKDGKCIDAEGVLGGAYLTMDEAVKNFVTECKLPLTDGLAMASLIPAKVMGLDHELGRIKAGFRAELIYMDLNSFQCQVCE